MRVCVLSGSPKGKNSVTWQTVRYLEKRYPNDTFETLHVGQQIRALEADLTPALEAVRRAELLLFCYPVYTFAVPAQLYRFIELLKASGENLDGKAAAQICTSKHCFDVTANQFIIDNCADMKLAYLGELSADMDDLLKEKGRQEADAFWNLVHWRAENHLPVPAPSFTPRPVTPYVPSGVQAAKQSGHEVVIVANLTAEDHDLAAMIDDFRAQYPHASKVVNVVDYPFSGGCLGCLHCSADGTCVLPDHFDAFLREEIQSASTVVYAFRISDHLMGARMKLYDDRNFCNGHRAVTAGKPIGYLICGDLDAEPNLRMLMDARSELGGNTIAGRATDPAGVAQLVQELEYMLTNSYTAPARFYGVGGHKIFRDLVYALRGIVSADHKYYQTHHLYDFPQRQKGTILKMKLVGWLVNTPALRKKIGNKMVEGMLAPYQRVLDSLPDPHK